MRHLKSKIMDKNTKIVFLDFDGVVTTVKSHWHFDPEKMALLGDILDATDAKIVITSSWRRYTLDDTIDFITKIEEEMGHVPFAFPDKVIGVTRRMYAFCYPNVDKHYSVVRGEEIRRWQEENDAEDCPYVILDDDSDMLLWQKDNFIQTDSELGLSEDDCKKAIAILNKEG